MDRMNVFNDNNLVHYEGELGIFDYDPEEFKVEKFNDGTECLHYCGKGNSVDLPDGCIDTRYMFCRRRLPEGFSLGEHFDTSKVTDMYGMFAFFNKAKSSEEVLIYKTLYPFSSKSKPMFPAACPIHTNPTSLRMSSSLKFILPHLYCFNHRSPFSVI